MPRVKKEVEKNVTPEPLMPEFVVNRNISRSRSFSFTYLPWLLIVAVILVAGYFVYNQQKQAKTLKQELTELKQNPQKITEDETKALLEKVGQLIELPNEQPTIATVTDPSSLKDQAFFANAQVDDRVLIYSVAKKAYLYRPSTNKVIEVAPVNLEDDSKAVKQKSSNTNTANSNTSSSTNSNKNTSSSSNSNTNTKSANAE